MKLNIMLPVLLITVLVLIYYSGIFNNEENFSSKYNNYCNTVIDRKRCMIHLRASSHPDFSHFIFSPDYEILNNKKCIRKCHTKFYGQVTEKEKRFKNFFKLLNKSLNDDIRRRAGRLRRAVELDFCFNNARIAGIPHQKHHYKKWVLHIYIHQQADILSRGRQCGKTHISINLKNTVCIICLFKKRNSCLNNYKYHIFSLYVCFVSLKFKFHNFRQSAIIFLYFNIEMKMNITFLTVLVGVKVMIYYSGILNKDENFSSKHDNYCKSVINRNMCKHHVQAVSRF